MRIMTYSKKKLSNKKVFINRYRELSFNNEVII